MVARYAAAFGAWALQEAPGNSRSVVLGRDSRVSGPLFHQVARAALESVGADVIDLGLTTTPTLQMAVEHHHAAGGLVHHREPQPDRVERAQVHRPAGLFLNAAEGAAMRAFVEGGIPYATWDRLGTTHFDGDAIARHLQAVLKLPFINVGAIRARGFRVAYDACRGAGGAIIPHLLELLGCEVHAINLETDGRFPRPPEPVPENLGDLERLVKDTGAQIGFATDPDVDRLAVVSDEGVAIGEDYTLALACRVVLRHRKGHVVTNLSTSRVVDDAAAEHGQRVIRAPVGEVNVAMRIRAEHAVIGGEGNGGVILPELHLGRDAPLGVALLLQLLLEDPAVAVGGSWRGAPVRDHQGQARPPDCAAWTRCTRHCGAAFPRRRSGHPGRLEAHLARSLGARAAVGHRADRARDRRGAHARGGAKLVDSGRDCSGATHKLARSAIRGNGRETRTCAASSDTLAASRRRPC